MLTAMKATDSTEIKTSITEQPGITCSGCGALIRTNTTAGSEPICLICHARMLNDRFRQVRQPRLPGNRPIRKRRT